MQRGIDKYNYEKMCQEIRDRFGPLAPREVVLPRSANAVIGTSSLKQQARLALVHDQDMPGAPKIAERDQEPRWPEALKYQRYRL